MKLRSCDYLRQGSALTAMLLAMAFSSPVEAALTLGDRPGLTQMAVAAPPIEAGRLEAGRQLFAQKQYAQAVTTWQTAAAQFQKNGDRASQALALSYVSLAQQELGQWRDASTAIEQSLQLLDPQSSAALWAQILNTQANLQLRTGKADNALATWQQSEKYYQQAQDSIGRTGSQINQAQALKTLGYYRRAKQQLEQVNLDLRTQPDSELKAIALRNLGNALQVIGDAEASNQALKASYAIAQKFGNPDELSATLLSLGKAAIEAGDDAAAFSAYAQAEDAATNPIDKIPARLGQLNLRLESGDLNGAQADVAQLYAQLKAAPASRSAVYNAINFAAMITDTQQPSQLISIGELGTLLAQSVKQARSLEDTRAEAYALHQWSKLYSRLNQWSDALIVNQQALNLARNLQADDIISQAAWQSGRILKAQGQRTQAIAAYAESVKSLQALRGDLIAISSDVQFSFRESVEPVYRELVALLLSPKDLAPLSPSAKAIDNTNDTKSLGQQPAQADLLQARQLIEALQVAELDNFFREACLDQVKQIDEVDASATVVYPIILPDRLAVIMSTAGQPLRYFSTPRSNTEVRSTLDNLLAALHPSSDNLVRKQLATQVYDWLIRPAEAAGAFKDTKTLVFVLDGPMRNIPMAALYDGQKYLVENYAITLSPGLQLMASQNLNAQNMQAIVGGISESRGGFSPLPAVKTEIQGISTLIKTSQTLLNQQFTVQALSKQLRSSPADVIHLATHGQFSSRLDDTFLLTWDGRINIKDLSTVLQSRSNAQSRPIELLVLSACDTAAGDDRAALGLAGLAVKSGARSTLASLWPVKDKAAALLMTRFYHHLSQPDSNKAQALQRAQLDLLRQKDFEDPFFWSSFVLVGNWR